jgi:hypothetical protein
MAQGEGADQRNTKADAKDNHYDDHAEGRRMAATMTSSTDEDESAE